MFFDVRILRPITLKKQNKMKPTTRIIGHYKVLKGCGSYIRVKGTYRWGRPFYNHPLGSDQGPKAIHNPGVFVLLFLFYRLGKKKTQNTQITLLCYFHESKTISLGVNILFKYFFKNCYMKVSTI